MIEGFFDDSVPGPLPRVALAVSIPKLVPTPRVVKFVLDTGAMQSCIHPVDATQLLLIDRELLASPPPTWIPVSDVRGVGGMADYYEHPCRYTGLQAGASGLHELNGRVWIARMTHDSVRLPSVLGWDVLQYFRIDIDYATKRVRLLEPGEA